MQPTISFIGAGKVANVLARLWYQAGYTIKAVYNRTPSKAENLAEAVSAHVAPTPEYAIMKADLTCIAVSDDAIEDLAKNLSLPDMSGKGLIHTSGAASIDKLQVAAVKGAMLGSLHPALPFADLSTTLQGATFAIEASHTQLIDWLHDLVSVVGGNPIFIPEGKKALYHAALVLTSNYTVTLYSLAHAILREFATDDTEITETLLPLLKATVANIETQGVPEALTGPLTRTDLGTISAHLNALNDSEIKATYVSLARATFPMLIERGIDILPIEKLLREHS